MTALGQDPWLVETYFDWLRSEAFTLAGEQRHYEGVLRCIHDIPFYWLIWSDENRQGDALSFRQNDFLGFQTDLDRLDQHWLQQWAVATPSVLEVLLGIARRWAYYFGSGDGSECAYYFHHLFHNLGLNHFPGKHLTSSSVEQVRHMMDIWMSRQFQPDGQGSPFPLTLALMDMRAQDIWAQMNAYSAEHFQ